MNVRYLFLTSAFFLIVHAINAVNFVLFTEPKTGTHLLAPILTALTNKKIFWAKNQQEISQSIENYEFSPFEDQELFIFSGHCSPWNRQTMEKVWATNQRRGTFLHLHAPYSQTMENFLIEKRCVNFFIKRDPRDQVVSLLNHYKHIDFLDKTIEAIPTDAERLLYMIRTHLRARTLNFTRWLQSPVCCALDFSKLMGAHGGAATDEDVLDQMRKIASALRLGLPDQYLMSVYKQCFGTGWNFFKGKVGSWKEYFNEEHKAAAKEVIGDLLIELGFEKDYNW